MKSNPLDTSRTYSVFVSFLILCAATGAMAYISLVAYRDSYITLAYGLPLLVCLWRQDKLLLWSMVVALFCIATIKAFLLLEPLFHIHWAMHTLNILAIALSVRLAINTSERLHQNNEQLKEANAELRVVVQFHEDNPHPVMRIDRSGMILYANSSASSLLSNEGWRAGDVSPQVLYEPAQSALHRNEAFSADIDLEDGRSAEVTFMPVASGDYVNVYGHDVTAQRRAQIAVRHSEALFRGTFENAAVGISHVDRDRRFLRVNRYLADLLGYTPEQLTRGDFSELTWPEDREVDASHFVRLTRGELDNYSVQKRYVKSNGQPVWALVTRAAQRDEHGAFLYAITIIQDISELRALTEKLQRYELITNNLRDIVLFLRLEDWRILEANLAAEKAYGYSHDELLEMTIQDLRAPSTYSMTGEQLDEAFVQGILFETVHLRKDGSKFPVEVSSRGAVIGGMRMLVSVIRDSTARKKAEEALRRSEETSRARADELKAIMEAVPALTLISHDPEGRTVTGNMAAYDILRFTPGSNLSLHEMSQAGHIRVTRNGQELAPSEVPVFKAALLGQELRGEELELTFDDGAVVYLVGNAAPLRDAEGGVRGSVGVFIDICNRKLYEAQLKKLADDLAQSNKDLERFAYVASHDLQEPLRQIVGFADMIVRRYSEQLDESGKEFLDYIVDGGHRMQNLIQDLLTYSRAGRRDGARAITDLNAVVDRVLLNLRLLVEESEAAITVDHLPSVVVDPTQFEQVFQNLISNALKFRSSEPPCVRIGAEGREDHWVVWVQDNGIGFEEGEAAQLFEMFQRLHKRSEYAGTGIGLAICKRIVELHGGQIWAKSKPGEGSTFYFTLPRKRG